MRFYKGGNLDKRKVLDVLGVIVSMFSKCPNGKLRIQIEYNLEKLRHDISIDVIDKDDNSQFSSWYSDDNEAVEALCEALRKKE